MERLKCKKKKKRQAEAEALIELKAEKEEAVIETSIQELLGSKTECGHKSLELKVLEKEKIARSRRKKRRSKKVHVQNSRLEFAQPL